MQMIDLMQRLAELDAGNPNVIREGQDSPTLQQLKAMLQKYSGTPFIFQLNKRIADQQWREANGKGDPVDASGRPVPVLSPEEFQKKYPTYLKTGEKPAPATDGKKNWLVTPDEAKASQDAEAAAQFTLKENAELAECGMMPMPGMGGQPHTPASISMTANSGPELSGMLADIMKLAGVHQVEPAHLGIEHEPAVLTAEPSMDLDHDHSNGEIMRSVMDKMNPDMDDEEETDEGMWDNSPADTEPPAPFDANEFAHRENQPGQGDRMDGDKPKGFPTMEEQLMADWKQFMTEGVAEGEDWTGSLYDPDWLPKGKKKPKLSDIKVKFPPKKQEPKQQGVEPKQQGVAGGSKSTKTYNDGIEDSIELLKTLSGNSIDYIIDRLQDYQYAYEKKHGVAKGTGRMETYNDGIEDSIELLKTLSGNSIDYIIDRLQDYQYAYEKKQGVAEAAKWRHDDLEDKTWRSADWDDGDLSPGKIQIDRHGKDVDDSGDELNARPGMWGGKYKRMTKKGTPTQHELGMQNNTKMRMKMQNKQGGLTGPKGRLPEE